MVKKERKENVTGQEKTDRKKMKVITQPVLKGGSPINCWLGSDPQFFKNRKELCDHLHLLVNGLFPSEEAFNSKKKETTSKGPSMLFLLFRDFRSHSAIERE